MKIALKIIFAIVSIAAVLVVIWLLLTAGSTITTFMMFDYFNGKLNSELGIPKVLTTTIAIILALVFMYAIRLILSLKKEKRKKGILILISCLLAWSLSYYFIRDKQMIDPRTGKPLKRYSRDIDGGIVYHDNDIFYDPTTGEKTLPVNKDILAEQLQRKQKSSKSLKVVYNSNLNLFDPITGKPLYFYYEDANSHIDLFRVPIHPTLGVKLESISKGIAEKILSQQSKQSIPKMKLAATESIIKKTEEKPRRIKRNSVQGSFTYNKNNYQRHESLGETGKSKTDVHKVYVKFDFSELRKLRDTLIAYKKEK